MTSAPMDRAEFKRACLNLLDEVAIEHPAGHQGAYAARYILRSEAGLPIALMFEKGLRTPAHLWVATRHLPFQLPEGVKAREYPAAALYRPADDGEKAYGRHAGLKAMRELANIDLVRLTVETVGQLTALVQGLKAV